MGNKPVAPTGADAPNEDAPVFMDSSNDGDDKKVIETYEKQDTIDKKKSLLMSKNTANSTALHLASQNGHAEIVAYLVEKIVTDCNDMANELINAKNTLYFTPLFCACFRGYHTKGDRDYC